MTVLAYKGYQGSVTWEDGLLAIRVLHIDDLVIDHCRDAAKVENTFHALVDEYIETCSELDREPEKPFKGSFNVRISPDLHRLAAMAATSAGISLNAWITDAVHEKLQSGPARIGWRHLGPMWQVLTGASLAGGIDVTKTLLGLGGKPGTIEVLRSFGTSRHITKASPGHVTTAREVAVVRFGGTTSSTPSVRKWAAGASSGQSESGHLRSGAEQ